MYKGITSVEANALQEKYGKNELTKTKNNNLFFKIIGVLCEPMFLLLFVASIIYFVLGEPLDGIVMFVFIIGIITIDLFQEIKTDKTLNALKNLSEPKVKVIRDGCETEINSADIVPNDLIIIFEGTKIPADGFIEKANDLCVNESTLTGEAEGVWKTDKNIKDNNDYWKKNYVYAGTTVINGSAYIRVDKIGELTEYGKIGKNIAEAKEIQTPLNKQIKKLIKWCAIFAGVLFLLVAVVTFINSQSELLNNRFIDSILAGITIAIALIPEEFPVVLTVFLSMGAWRLAKKQALIRKLSSVETLGAVTVLCVDKTGTITKNEMEVYETFANDNDMSLIKVMGMACETDTYDNMEKAMLDYCFKHGLSKKELFKNEMVFEYPFTNENKMMGHIWKENNTNHICVKGSPESVLKLCKLSSSQLKTINLKINEMSEKGLRVIAVAEEFCNKYNNSILECDLTFCGLIGLIDPPRDNIEKSILSCQQAGIKVVMITGDNGITATSIARKVGIKNPENVLTGDEIDNMSDDVLQNKIKEISVFARIIPEAKMRIVKAFQKNNEVVAMTGDGVNDAPALKHADIGISMGKNGSEVSREAADLILLNDDFSTIVSTIKDGRRIYANIKKAISYILTIHVPLALSALIAPLLAIDISSLLFLPIHVVLMELIIDPTCSIVLERQPAENNIMQTSPRKISDFIISFKSIMKSLFLGLVVFAFSFGSYYLLNPNSNPEIARSMAIAIIIISNLFIVQVNSSETDFAIVSFNKMLKDKVMWVANILAVLFLIIIIYSPLNVFLKLAPLTVVQILIAVGLSFVSVIWIEIIKLFNKLKTSKKNI